MFYKLLKQGKKIKIYDKKGVYTPATFYCKNNDIYYDSDALGHNCKHDVFTNNFNKFNEHIQNMLDENFSINID